MEVELRLSVLSGPCALQNRWQLWWMSCILHYYTASGIIWCTRAHTHTQVLYIHKCRLKILWYTHWPTPKIILHLAVLLFPDLRTLWWMSICCEYASKDKCWLICHFQIKYQLFFHHYFPVTTSANKMSHPFPKSSNRVAYPRQRNSQPPFFFYLLPPLITNNLIKSPAWL